MISNDYPFSNEINRFIERHHYSCVAPRAALIDMDGTLYDSMPRHARAWHRMMTDLGVDCRLEEFFMYEGRTGASTINILFNRAFGRDATPDEVERYYRRKTELFAASPTPVEPMPGAREVMDIFCATGLRRVLVTGSGQNTLLNRLDTDYPGVFLPGMRVTSRDVVHGKPHPEPFIRAMQLAGVSPSQAIVLENAPLGVEAGDRAGAFTIGVTTGPVPRSALVDAGAAVVFDSMRQCAEAMPSLLLSLTLSANDQ